MQKDKYDVYIGRKNKDLLASKWQNPFKMSNESERDYVCLMYELYLNTRPDLLVEVKELKDKILGCYCYPKKCHGDILVEYSRSRYIKNWFSNMLPMSRPLIYQGICYKTSENFYQAMKLPKNRIDLRAKIANMTAYEAKKNIKSLSCREDWEDEKLLIMEYILRHKFAKGTVERYKLDLTKDWEIVEWNNWNDLFWGKSITTKTGENHLGKILMKIRDN